MVNDFQSRKCALRAVLRDAASVPLIQDAVRRCDSLWTHGLLFIKGFLLKKYEQDPERAHPFPRVDTTFVLNALRVVGGVHVQGGSEIAQQQRQEFYEFFIEDYAPTKPAQEAFTPQTNVTQILNYLSQELVVDYDNNVKQHWLQHFNHFLEDGLNKRERLKRIDDGEGTVAEKKASKTALFRELDAVKTDIMNSRNEPPYVKQSLPYYHAWIDRAAYLIMPRGRLIRENDVMYDIACSPQDYLYGMVFMGDFRETTAGLKNLKVKLLNVFPLKTSLVPRSIRIDTTSLLKLLDWGRPDSRKRLEDREGTLLDRKNAAWDLFFDLNLRIFKGNQNAGVGGNAGEAESESEAESASEGDNTSEGE